MISILPNKEEFIGCLVTIEHCTDPTWIGKQGIIVDETKHLFLIEIQNTIKRIEKKTATFKISLSDKTIRLNGSKIVYRPEDRIKKAR
ncbi:MAG: ribonuclease P protein subunit [Candidatus Thermoplasmatota archaeon]|nr:ribonuclease P protein subunit [Candidatus Thermoplasmatota archaeon]